MSVLKSYMKCELPTISSRIDLLSQFVDIKTNNLDIQQEQEQVSKKFYVGNLDKDITEEDLNQLFGLKTAVYLRQTCSIEMPLDKNTGKSRICFLKCTSARI